MKSRSWWIRGLVAGCALVLAGCSLRAVVVGEDSSTTLDGQPGSRDGSPGGRDTGPGDLPVGPDRRWDRGPVPQRDAGPPPALRVLYFDSTGSGGLALTRIRADGTGKTRVGGVPVPFPLTHVFQDLWPAELAAVSRHRPMSLLNVAADHRPVALPGKLGLLFPYTVNSGIAALVVRPDGKVTLPGAATGTSQWPRPYMTSNRAGTLLVAAHSLSGDPIYLVSTDGARFHNGKTSCEVKVPSFSQNDRFHAPPAFAGKHLYFSVQGHLVRAPLDCSRSATEVKMPSLTVETSSPGDQLLVSEDESHFAMHLYGGVVVVNDATGKATLMANTDGNYTSPGWIAMYYDPISGTHIGLSPRGRMLAWMTEEKSGDELHVRPVDRSRPALQVTSGARLPSSIRNLVAVHWLNDDDLVFWAGSTAADLDLMHYRVSTGKLVNLTPSSSTLTHPEGGWFGRNGRFLYYLEYSGKDETTARCDLRAIDRATASIRNITKNLYVYFPGTNLEASSDSGRVFFFGRPAASATKQQNLYVFDQDTGSAAVKLTDLPGYSRIYGIQPSPDGRLVAFGVGQDPARQQLYVVQVNSSPVVRKLTTRAGYLSEMKLFSSDGKYVVYAHGSSTASLPLLLQPISGGVAHVVDPGASRTSPLAVW